MNNDDFEKKKIKVLQELYEVLKIIEPPGQEWFRKWEKELDISEKLRMEKSDLEFKLKNLFILNDLLSNALKTIANDDECWATDRAKDALAEIKKKENQT